MIERKPTPRQEAIFRALYDLNLVYGRGQLKTIRCLLDDRGRAQAGLQYGVSNFSFRTEDKPGDRITVFARGHQVTVKVEHSVETNEQIIRTAGYALGIEVTETLLGFPIR